MSKQIKVSDEVYARLKKVSEANYRPMSAQIEYLLSLETGVPQKTEAPKPRVDDLFPEKIKSEPSGSGALPDAMDILRSSMEQPCCTNEITPCKHWVWDSQSGEGYKNVLSGRIMEVEG